MSTVLKYLIGALGTINAILNSLMQSLKRLKIRAFSLSSGYAQGAVLVALITATGYMVQLYLAPTNIVMLYLLGVVLMAVYWGFGPSIMVCVLSVLAHDFFFVEPLLSFGPPDIQEIATLLVFLVVGMIISYLTSQVRLYTEKSMRHERETHTLYVLSRNLATSDELDASVRAIVKSIKETLGYDTAVFLPDPKNKAALKLYTESTLVSSRVNVAEALWAFQHQQPAGRGNGPFPESPMFYVPLVTARGPIGVLGLLGDEVSRQLTEEQRRLINAFADLIALAIERINFAEEWRTMQSFQAATEKLQTALLDSISHDIRTPLSSVIGALSSLQEEWYLDDATKKNLIQVAREEAERLNNTITNLLDSSRIQAGAIQLARQPGDVKDMISVALLQLGDRVGGRDIRINTGAELPFISADFSLIVKVIFNLLDNAVKYSVPGSPVEIRAGRVGREVEIEVSDRGSGIPPHDLPHLFQRFYRVPGTGVLGTGLGLSISKGIVEAHGGRISAENRQGGGLTVRFTLPMAYPDEEG